MESFQDLSLEDSQCWESMELSTESFKTMGAIILSCTFLGALALKWLFHYSYRWNRPKPWELSLKTYLSAFFPRALTLKWLFRESYRWNRPKPWELSLKTNPPRPKLWELLFKKAKTMGAIAQNEAPEAIWTKLPWKWVSRSHLSFLSKNTKISRDFSASKCGQFQY